MFPESNQDNGWIKRNTRQQTREKSEFLTVQEAAAFLHVSPLKIYKDVNQNEIPYMQQLRSRRLYFSKAELIQIIKDNRYKTQLELDQEAHKKVKIRDPVKGKTK